ncbi:MAG: GNAT family N-acetyltransferase [Oscillospiraceae bacterium]|nr:GNAT family N-acetyltransferase [Oscillospiraceae bacterium]
MKLELRPIDSTNKKAAELLEVAENQKQYIASNKASLETAAKEEYRSIARPFAIYADGKMVGFTMFAFELDSDDPQDRYWLWRFMIDKAYQTKGCGSAALETVIAYFKHHGADHILLSTKPANTAALSLYRKYRFVETGEMNGDEIILRLAL